MPDELLIPPTPADARDAARWLFTSLVRRIVDPEQTWEADATQRVREMVGTDRQFAWRRPDTTAPLIRVYADTLCRAYSKPPAVAPPNDLGTEVLREITRGRHWVWMQESHAEAWASGELFVRVDLDRRGRPTFRRVPADRVVVRPDPEHPDRPMVLAEAAYWSDEKVWVWHVYDISDPDHPSWTVRRDVRDEWGENLTERVLGQTFDGDAYPFRFSDGEPYVPFVVYRGVESGRFWHAYARQSLVEATLNVCVYLTYFGHILRNASWPQRYVVNADFPGAVMDDAGGEESRILGPDARPMRRESAHLVADPATIVRLVTQLQTDSGHVLVGQWQPGGDPKVVFEALQMYIGMASSFSGVSGSDQMRITGDPRSGYAIMISRTALREEQSRSEPVLRRADEELIRMTAAQMSRDSGRAYPEDGYTIEYMGIPESPDEVAARRQHVLELLDRGLSSPVDAYRAMHPGATDEEAVEALLRIQRERRRFVDLGAAMTDPAGAAPADEPEPTTPEPEAEPDQVPEPASGTEQAEGLDGAQIREAVAIADRVAFGEMERSVAEILLIELGMDPERAARMVAAIQPRTRPVGPGQAPAPPTPPPNHDDEE